MHAPLPVHPHLVHPHTGEPLEAVGVLPNGRPVWPVMGAADDDKPDPADDGKSDDKPDPADDGKSDDKSDLTAEQLRAELAKTRREAAKYRTEARDAGAKVKDYEDRDKTEQQKAADKATAAETRAQEAEIKALRLEVAFDKGLTPAQARRLAGTTKEELEADADELLELFAGSNDDSGGKPPVRTRPKERLRGGGDPDDEPEETDPAKLAASIPRRY